MVGEFLGFERIGDQRTRHIDQVLALQFRGQAMRLGGLAAQVRGLETVEVAFAEPGENGIANQLQEFWSGWENLADAPENPAARQALVENARGLTTTIAALDSQLATLEPLGPDERGVTVDASGDVDEVAAVTAALLG